MDLMTDVNLTKESVKKMVFKKVKKVEMPFEGNHEVIKGSPDFHRKVNNDEIARLESRMKIAFAKSPALKVELSRD
jgi:hypothetical protein